MEDETVSVVISGPRISVEESAPLNDARALDEMRKLINGNFRHLIAKAQRANPDPKP